MKFVTLAHVQCPQCHFHMAKRINNTIACETRACGLVGIQFELPSFDLQPTSSGVVSASATGEVDVVQALFAVELPTTGTDGTLPTDIQWMPPGAHPISAEKNGKPYKTTINVTAKTAATVQARFEAQMTRAKAGEDDYPFLDFNHNDEEASAHPTEFYWGGDDPKTGGVRCKLTWTDAGASAVKGRSYRRFSPQFKEDGKGNVTDLPLNAGGLVNRAAFKKIQALAAKHSPATNPNEERPYMKLMDLLKKHGLITDTGLDETDAVSQVSAKLTEYATLSTENGTLKTKVTDLEGTITKSKETHAKSVVAGLVKAGAIAPKDLVLQARYEKLLIDDPENEAILPKAPNAALGGAVVKAKRNETPGEDLGTDDLAEPLITKAREMAAKDETLDLGDAVVKACEADEEAYNAWRYSNGLGPQKERDAYVAGRN